MKFGGEGLSGQLEVGPEEKPKGTLALQKRERQRCTVILPASLARVHKHPFTAIPPRYFSITLKSTTDNLKEDLFLLAPQLLRSSGKVLEKHLSKLRRNQYRNSSEWNIMCALHCLMLLECD